MRRLSDKDKADAFENLCTQLHYARIAGSNERVRAILDAVDDYCRADQGEFSEEEKDERTEKSFEALKKI